MVKVSIRPSEGATWGTPTTLVTLTPYQNAYVLAVKTNANGNAAMFYQLTDPVTYTATVNNSLYTTNLQ